VFGEIFEDGEGRHGEDLLFAHDAHCFVAELQRVIYGRDTGARGVERAGLAHGVHRDAMASARGFVDGGGEFFFGVLVWRGEMAIDDLVRAGFVNFDEVGAFLELAANHGDEFGGVVGVGRVRKDALLGIEADGVFVAAEKIHSVAADAQARAGNESLVDGVAHGGVGGACAFGAHVALGGESGQEVVTRGDGGEDGALGNGFLDGLQIFGAGMQEKMDVRVNQAGEQGGVAEVDEFGAVRMRDFVAGFDDEIVLDQDFAGSGDAAGFDTSSRRAAWRTMAFVAAGGAGDCCCCAAGFGGAAKVAMATIATIRTHSDPSKFVAIRARRRCLFSMGCAIF
jgi:hypothetical protein